MLTVQERDANNLAMVSYTRGPPTAMTIDSLLLGDSMRKEFPVKARSCTSFLPLILVSGFGLTLAGRITAQTFTKLHDFTGNDGANPFASLILSGSTLYGTAVGGGDWSNGVVFAVSTHGTGFTNLHSFSALSGSYPFYINNDGASPYAGLLLSGGTLYGTAEYGGNQGNGSVFAVHTDGTGFTTLHSFTAMYGDRKINYDGANPFGGLVLSGDTLFGTTLWGGDPGIYNYGSGTVFKGRLGGTDFTNLHSFNGGDGTHISAVLVLSGNTLYGTAATGGYGPQDSRGTVFKVNTDGAGFAILHSFSLATPSYSTNSDGANPYAGLVLWSNTLYGTAAGGGSACFGTVFAVGTDGKGFTNLHSFTGGSDGAAPRAGLVLFGNTLYGTTVNGGVADNGTVFKIDTVGTGFTSLYSFTALSVPYSGTNSDGAYPFAGLVLSGNTLYGTARGGGSSGLGTVFRLSLPLPQLIITRHGANVILAWPGNVVDFSLQSAFSITGPFTCIPIATNPYTNLITGTQQFFRLISN
jgi:uncharacterized repeat protein (TIGR03803 family)